MGGIERAMSTLANYFVSKGHEIHYITLLPLDHFFELNNHIYFYQPHFPFKRKGMSVIEYIVYYCKVFAPWGYLRQTVKKIKPDTIMSFGDFFPQVSLISLLGIPVPFYLSNRSSPEIVYGFGMNILRSVAYFLRKPDGVIAQTSAAAERKKRIFGPDFNIKLIPNPARKIIKCSVSKKNWIVSVGRLHKEKGYDRLIKAFSNVDCNDWNLVIAGKGIDADYFYKFAEDLHVSDRIIFVGNVKNVDELLNESKIFVLPSYREGFPNALCEAMAAGLPSIAFDIVAGPRDIIQDGVNGYLIKDNDIIELSRKLKFLIENCEERERLGMEAQKITDRYSLEKIGDSFLDFILENI
jgi:glycosyltransferase involved in cell wall biosynthesis